MRKVCRQLSKPMLFKKLISNRVFTRWKHIVLKTTLKISKCVILNATRTHYNNWIEQMTEGDRWPSRKISYSFLKSHRNNTYQIHASNQAKCTYCYLAGVFSISQRSLFIQFSKASEKLSIKMYRAIMDQFIQLYYL